jgi:CheY-like chemotaxis protein
MYPDVPPPLRAEAPAELDQATCVPFGRAPRILVVDDELCIRTVLSDLLKAERYLVDTAANGASALQSIIHDPPDVVLTDRTMPVMDGETLAREIKRLRLNLPVILVTGLAGTATDLRLFDAVIAKPFARQRILDAITFAIDSKSRRREAA